MLLVLHVWIIQRRLKAALALATACVIQAAQKQQMGRVRHVRAAHSNKGFLTMIVLLVPRIRFLLRGAQRVRVKMGSLV